MSRGQAHIPRFPLGFVRILRALELPLLYLLPDGYPEQLEPRLGPPWTLYRL